MGDLPRILSRPGQLKGTSHVYREVDLDNRQQRNWGKARSRVAQQLISYFFSVRLVDGKHRWEGTVEVLYRGIWGTVCDNGWDIWDANTVCRQLSFKGAVAAPRRSAFGSHYRTRWMDQVQCKGNESTLSDCLHNGLGVDYCSSYSLASVVCHRQGESIWQCLWVLQRDITQSVAQASQKKKKTKGIESIAFQLAFVILDWKKSLPLCIYRA